MEIPTLIYCANGNPRFARIAKDYGFLIGAQLPGTLYDVHLPLYFADQDFKKPRYVAYIKALKKYRPYLATVLDIMEYRRLDEYLMRAKEISQYCEEIMLIPKVKGIVKELPRKINNQKVRLGYSVPTQFGGTLVSIEEFDGWPVHLLGGSPKTQLQLATEFDTISVDGNYAQKVARFGMFWTGKKWLSIENHDGRKWGDDMPYEAFRRSCENIMASWNNLKTT